MRIHAKSPNQHYVSKVLLRRFKKPGSPLQRYSVQSGDWEPRNPENVFSAPGWNQLRLYGQTDDSLEVEFSKVESGLPETFRVLDRAAATNLTEPPHGIYRNLCQYCAFLWLVSPFAKAKAPLDFLLRVNAELQAGDSAFLRILSFDQSTIERFCWARARGQYAILYSDDMRQVVYRIQFRELYHGKRMEFLNWTKWKVCNSPIEFPLSDVPLVQVHAQKQNVICYALPVGPTLLLKGDCKPGPRNQVLLPQLHGKTLSMEQAEAWRDAICSSAVTELVSTQIIPDIAAIRERTKAKGIAFPTIVDPDRDASLALTEFNGPFGLRMVSHQEFVEYVHTLLKPPVSPGGEQSIEEDERRKY